jgi:hypothetical protein
MGLTTQTDTAPATPPEPGTTVLRAPSRNDASTSGIEDSGARQRPPAMPGRVVTAPGDLADQTRLSGSICHVLRSLLRHLTDVFDGNFNETCCETLPGRSSGLPLVRAQEDQVTRQPSQHSSPARMAEQLAALSPELHALYGLFVDTRHEPPCRYVAVARHLGVHPYAVVATDLAEFSADLNLAPTHPHVASQRAWPHGSVAC